MTVKKKKPRGPISVHVQSQDLRASVVPQSRASMMADWFKRQGEIAIGFVALCSIVSGLYVGIVSITGGHLVPWSTPDGLERMRLSLLEGIHKDIAATDEALHKYVEMGLKGLRDDHNISECEDYNGRLDRAAQILMMNPNDENQRSIYRFATDKLNRIPDCKPIVIPILPMR